MRQMYRHCSCLVLLLVSLTPDVGLAQHADQLGRLFSTPRERMELDEIRRIWQREVAPGEEFEQQENGMTIIIEAPNNLYLQLGGTVRRADGSYSLWLNNEPVDQHQLPSNIKLARLGDLIVLWINYQNTMYVVRPGQVLHFASKAVYEPYALPDDLSALIYPEPVTDAVLGSPAAPRLSSTPPADSQNDSAPMSMVPGGAAIEGITQGISGIAETLSLIQELTQ